MMKPDEYKRQLKAARQESKGEAVLNQQLEGTGRRGYVREYPFARHVGREWRFDFANPDEMIAIEVEGGTKFGRSAHSMGAGFEKDRRKYNLAQAMGWTVLAFSTEQVMRGEVLSTLALIETLREAAPDPLEESALEAAEMGRANAIKWFMVASDPSCPKALIEEVRGGGAGGQ